MRRQPRITKICKLQIGFRHPGVAEFTANKILIRPVKSGVHGTTGGHPIQATISLMQLSTHDWHVRHADLDIVEAAVGGGRTCRRNVMAKEGNAGFEIPADMRALAEKSVEQAKQAFDIFISAAQARCQHR